MKFGLSLIGDSNADWERHAVAADGCGFWGLGVGDSQSIYPDPYVRLTLAARSTQNLRLGPWVTNPVTRHPAVTAGAISTIQEISGGRALLGLGTGDSSLANIGLRPSSVDHLERYVTTVQQLMRSGSAQWEGAAAKLVVSGDPVPVYVAASGPRTLQMAGRVADGAIIGTGVGDGIVEDSLALISAAAAGAGRSGAEPEVWWLLLSNLADTDEEAVSDLKNSLISYANLAFRKTFAGKHLPVELEDAVRAVQREYRPLEHAKFGMSHHAELADSLGLTDYLRGRFSLCGTPEGFVRQVSELSARGCENIWLNVRVRNKQRFLQLWKKSVVPLLNTAGLWQPPRA